MINVKPIYGQDYKPGTHLYMRSGGLLSNGIIWFETLQETAQFAASHCAVVVNDVVGLESSTYGVEYFKLSRYFDNPNIEVVCKEPLGLDNLSFQQAYARGCELEQSEAPYDYLSLLLGFPVAILARMTDLFPFMRKWPIPFHIPNARVCSAFLADIEKHTDKYKDIQLFKDWNITRITPVMLYNHFPYKPIRLEPH